MIGLGDDILQAIVDHICPGDDSTFASCEDAAVAVLDLVQERMAKDAGAPAGTSLHSVQLPPPRDPGQRDKDTTP